MNIDKLLNLNSSITISANSINSLIDKPTFVFYLPEPGIQGKNFVNDFRKKSIFQSAIIFKYYIFKNKKLNAQEYIQEFKKQNPNVPVITDIKTIKKQTLKNKIIFIDLTLFSELFLIQKSIIKFKAFYEYITIINDLIKSLNLDIKQSYIFYEGTASLHPFFDYLMLYLRRKSFTIDSHELKVSGIIAFDRQVKLKLYPFAKIEKEREKEVLKFKIPVLNQYQKEVLLQDEEEIKTEDDIINDIENKLKDFDVSKIKEEIKNNSKTKQSSEEIIKIQESKKEFNKDLDDIYNLLTKINPNKSPEENLEYLKEKFKNDETKKEFLKKADVLLEYLKMINKKYNGMIEIDENLITKINDSFFNPIDIVGFKEVNVYNRQSTEFDEVLDQSIYDLFKKIESDKELGIQILNIKSEIVDTNKDRLKKYYITIKQTKFGKKQPYTIELDVPYPIHDKYLKFGSNTYIMINQLFIKPLIKINPNTVRFYSFFGTITVKLKTHTFNELNDFDKIIDKLQKISKSKKLIFNYYEENERQKVNLLLEKYNIANLNDTFKFKKFDFEI